MISGDGFAFAPSWTGYEAELATFSGTASASYCGNCSGASEAGNIGGAGNNVTFTNVTAPEAGTYQMEIDYLTSGPRVYFISVNGCASTELDLNGSSFNLPTSTVNPVTLKAGVNTIQFGSPTGYSPGLDRIAIAKTVGVANLSGVITGKQGLPALRVWQLSLANTCTTQAKRSEANLFSPTQASGSGACHPKVLAHLPIEVGDIAPGAQRTVEVPIDFSKCSESALFTTSLVFSSNDGADVGNVTDDATTR